MEINSPPYPKNSGSPRDLFFNLTELYQWAAEQFDWANEEDKEIICCSAR